MSEINFALMSDAQIRKVVAEAIVKRREAAKIYADALIELANGIARAKHGELGTVEQAESLAKKVIELAEAALGKGGSSQPIIDFVRKKGLGHE